MTTKQGDRQKSILGIVTREGRVEVARLAGMLGVSRVTVRKDLDALEEKGLVRHEHGLALPPSGDDMRARLSYHHDIKRRIAQAAADMVDDGETVMIESGSCCAILADELVHRKRNLTIVTNSAFIAAYIRKEPRAKVILLGGDYQNEAQVTVGPIARQCAAVFSVDKLFIGADGFSEKTGFTGKDHLRAETVRDMAARARTVIILTESEKFGRQGTVPLLPPEAVGVLITDAAVPSESAAFLGERGVSVRTVSDALSSRS
jgi:DeoR/GlpR family transcriptional regulator of sugar metabolism